MEKWLTPAEVCELIPGMSVGLLSQLRFRGDGPPFVKPSDRKVVYRLSTVKSWLQSREQSSTRENIPA